jgi:hypothetical protein
MVSIADLFFWEDSMLPSVQAGTILIEDRPLMTHVLGLGCEPYLGEWGVLKGLDSFTLPESVAANRGEGEA